MSTILAEGNFRKKLPGLFEQAASTIFSSDTDVIRSLRAEAMQEFEKTGFPEITTEGWRKTNLARPLMLEYVQHLKPFENNVDVEKLFMCEVHDLESYHFTQLNGWLIHKNGGLTELPEGIIVGSLAAAFSQMPEIINKYYGRYARINGNGFTALNTAFAQDGLFIYVPDHVAARKPIQIINLINSSENIFIQPRNLVVLGKESSLKLLYCDHSLLHKHSLINSVTEIIVGQGAQLEHYKLQNKESDSTLITNTWIHQLNNSRLTCNILTLNAGIIRNNLNVSLNGYNCDSELYGLYLVDKEQHIDNHIFVDHMQPDCRSNQLFKGIIDDSASAVFNGHIMVRKNAQRTNAFQKNRNIQLTDKATVYSNPHLEIYADDVKCSHGSTVGQLDPNAMFYMRSRGISEDVARMALMNAFASEIIHKVNIEPLHQRIDELVSKRLRGELSICDQCILGCSARRQISFDITTPRLQS
ncbi:MAG TPA: Fe-S cluster assembly protein SufD [Bacteroidales bacterium]|nr:Fe-S cluster assembly protein SufD [Bacteroidales bacterium]